jgi:hypothetical protein
MHPGEGDEELSDKASSDSLAGGNHGKAKARPKRGRPGGRPPSSDVGKALRSVYDSTLREQVPGDFLDLLGKLN